MTTDTSTKTSQWSIKMLGTDRHKPVIGWGRDNRHGIGSPLVYGARSDRFQLTFEGSELTLSRNSIEVLAQIAIRGWAPPPLFDEVIAVVQRRQAEIRANSAPEKWREENQIFYEIHTEWRALLTEAGL